MPNMRTANLKPCNELHITHGLMDNVPGNSYVVKASGFAPAGHAQDLGIVPGLAPKAQQHKIGLTKSKVLGTGTPIVKNVLIQQQIELIEGDVEVSSGLGFCVELLDWFKRSVHMFCLVRIPLRNAGEQGCCTVYGAF
jgi:hypothetical protein